MRRPKGVSLAEAIIACFILTAAMAVSAALYHTALNYSVRIDRKHRAALVLQRRLETIRAWSRDQHGTNGPLFFTQGWSSYEGDSVDLDFPEFKIFTKIIKRDLYSPSSAFEKEVSFAAQADNNVPLADKDQKRTLNDSSYLIETTASWSNNPKDRLTARTLIADPVKDYGWKPNESFKAIQISTPPASLAYGQSFDITATIKDRNGRVVKNAVVQWYVDPNTSGNGTLEVSPETPDKARFINQVIVVKDPTTKPPETIKVYSGGSVRIVARVRLGGIEAVNKSNPVVLGDGPE